MIKNVKLYLHAVLPVRAQWVWINVPSTVEAFMKMCWPMLYREYPTWSILCTYQGNALSGVLSPLWDSIFWHWSWIFKSFSLIPYPGKLRQKKPTLISFPKMATSLGGQEALFHLEVNLKWPLSLSIQMNILVIPTTLIKRLNLWSRIIFAPFPIFHFLVTSNFQNYFYHLYFFAIIIWSKHVRMNQSDKRKCSMKSNKS